MQYQVPQFIEVESKVVGPLTLRQFIYIGGAVGLCVLFFVYLPLVFAILLSAGVAGLAGTLSFYKMNGKPFIEILEAGFNYYTGDKLFLWRRRPPKVEKAPVPETMKSAAPPIQKAPRLTSGKLSQLAWSLDVRKGGPADGKS